MTPKDRVIGALRGEDVDRVPVSCVTQVGIVEAMEEVGAAWPTAHSDPELMVKLGTALYKLTGLEAARIPFCLTVLAEALGCKVDMGTIDRQPSVAGHVLVEEIPDNLLERGRIPAVLKATKLMSETYKDLPIIVGFEGPFTLTGHMIGVEEMMIKLVEDRAMVEKTLDLATEVCIEYTKALIDAGAEVIVPCDPDASPDLIDPRDFASLVKPSLKKLAGVIHSRGAVGVLHICGRAQKVLKDMAETGFDALSFEEKVNVAEAKQVIGDKPTLVGNVSSAKTLLSGTPEEVKEEAKKAIADGIDVLAPGCGLAPRTPLANIKALVEVVKG